jgi:hypothetical protein
VACYGPIGPDDVGKDFAVTIRDGVARISVPDGKLFRYNIESAKEGTAAP